MAKTILLEKNNPTYLPGNWEVFQSSMVCYDKGEGKETHKLFVASDGNRVIRGWSTEEITAKALSGL